VVDSTLELSGDDGATEQAVPARPAAAKNATTFQSFISPQTEWAATVFPPSTSGLWEPGRTSFFTETVL
jgi:hypothetical protein